MRRRWASRCISERAGRRMTAAVTYLEAIRRGLWDAMEADPRVFLIGEDIGAYGGAFKVTEGFLEHFGAGRVLDSPISEAALVGAAVGAAMYGKRPVVEMQFIDFIANGFNPIVNFAAKLHYRLGVAAPLVIRGPSGGGVRGGPFHSQTVESFFLNVPGLKVAVPATVGDAYGLMRAAIEDPDPVLFFEHKLLYRRLKAPLPAPGTIEPMGRARVARAGRHLTLVTWSAMVQRCLEAAEVLAQSGIEAEVVDLRTLCPLDEATVLESVRRTHRALVVHESPQTGGFGGELVGRIVSGAFEWLDAPVERLGARDVPIPYAGALEDAVLPQVDGIIEKARQLARY